MPRRTISVTQIQYHPRYKTDDVKDVAALPDGKDLLHIFHGMLATVDPDQLVDDENERYASLEDLSPDGRTVRVRLAVGRFGEIGANRHVTSHMITHQHQGDEAHTLEVRALLVVPKTGTTALLFGEHAGSARALTPLLRILGKSWKHRYPDWTLKTASLVEENAWLAAAELEAVTATRYGWSNDIAQVGMPKVAGEISYHIEPPRGQRVFPKNILEWLNQNPTGRGRFLGIPDGVDPDEVKVQVGDGERSKIFVLGRERTPAVHYPFSESHTPAPSDESFKSFCLGEARTVFKNVGIGWQSSWRAGNWSANELAEAVEVPDE